MKRFNNYKLFIFIIILLAFITFSSEKILNTKEIINDFYSDKLSEKQISQFLIGQEKWSWLGYLLIPFFILIRTSLVTLCISIGLFFYETENRIKFKKLFRISLIGEFVLSLTFISKFFYFYFFKTDYTLHELQQFYPLSYTNLINLDNLEPWLVYPLQTINLFEIGYFFMLVFGLHKLLKNKYAKSFEIVAVSYGTGLVIWIGLIMFLTLNMF